MVLSCFGDVLVLCMNVCLWNARTSLVLIWEVISVVTRVILVRVVEWYSWNVVSVNCVSGNVALHGARVLGLSRFRVRGLDRSFDVSRVISHLVMLWMQVGMQGRTFSGLTQIRLSNHYTDNSSPVFVFTCFMWKKLRLCAASNEYVYIECVNEFMNLCAFE